MVYTQEELKGMQKECVYKEQVYPLIKGHFPWHRFTIQ